MNDYVNTYVVSYMFVFKYVIQKEAQINKILLKFRFT